MSYRVCHPSEQDLSVIQRLILLDVKGYCSMISVTGDATYMDIRLLKILLDIVYEHPSSIYDLHISSRAYYVSLRDLSDTRHHIQYERLRYL